MSTFVRSRARGHPDRGGDPLDGLVNLFDLGIVLSVAFLLAALSSLKLSSALTGDKGRTVAPAGRVIIKPGEKVVPLPARGARVVGRGKPAGEVYRLDDGRLVYVPTKP
jgi:hypothetical protein